MRCKVELVFIEVHQIETKKGKFQIPVFYDEHSKQLVKPFTSDEVAQELAKLKQYESVAVVLEQYTRNNGSMGQNLTNFMTKSGNKAALDEDRKQATG